MLHVVFQLQALSDDERQQPNCEVHAINTITITLRALRGRREELLQTIMDLQRKIKNEKGFLKFSIYQDVENVSVFHLIQDWETTDTLDSYIRSEAFTILFGALRVLSEEAEVKYSLGSSKQGLKLFEITNATRTE